MRTNKRSPIKGPIHIWWIYLEDFEKKHQPYSPWVIFQLISHGRWSLRLPPCKSTYKIFLPGKVCLRGLKASIADFGFYGPVFESRWHQQFSLWKRKGVTEIWTRDHRIQSQLCLPLDHKLMKNAWKIKKILAEHFQIQNLPTIW